MVHHLYPEFLSDEKEYQSVEDYWRRLLNDVARHHNEEGEWLPWMASHFEDGAAFPHDGNPILAVRSDRLKRAIRVIQSLPEDRHSVEVAAYLDNYDDPKWTLPRPTDELVINLALSEESAAIARTLIERWMDENTSKESMLALIRELAPPLG